MAVDEQGRPKAEKMCGPSVGSPLWKKARENDVRKANLAKGRKIREENLIKAKATKESEK